MSSLHTSTNMPSFEHNAKSADNNKSEKSGISKEEIPAMKEHKHEIYTQAVPTERDDLLQNCEEEKPTKWDLCDEENVLMKLTPKTVSKIEIIDSKYQTKPWVHKHISETQKDSGREKYQRKLVEQITQKECPKSKNIRINTETFEMRSNRRPLTKNGETLPDGFDWTEDFDGEQNINSMKYLYNFKFVTEGGGAQTRTLRECAHFIKAQLDYLKHNNNDIYFVNIFDGDCSYKFQTCFNYLLSKPRYNDVKKYIFVGDMKNFQDWYLEFNK